MATQKNNPMGNDWVPPAQSFGNSPEPIALVVADPVGTLLGWNQTNPEVFALWSFTGSGYAGTYTED